MAARNPALSDAMIVPTVPGATGEQFNTLAYGYGAGTYTIKSHNFDPTDWVRSHPELITQDVTWTVQYTIPEPSAAVLVAILFGCLTLSARPIPCSGNGCCHS